MEDRRHSSEEDEFDEDEDLCSPVELQGTLSKWTNYIHGWQDRFIALKDGTLSYYKSEHDTSYGCRGAISLHKAVIQAHEFDDSRFDVSVNDCVWYLRCKDHEERVRWMENLENYKAESGYGSENNLQRHGSRLSLTSLSTTSTASFKKGRGLREKLAEIETFRDILCRQIDSLQKYFDACSEASKKVEEDSMDDIDDDDDDDEEEENLDEFEHYAPKADRNRTSTMTANGQSSVAGAPHPLSLHTPHHPALSHPPHNHLQQGTPIDFKGEALTFKATTAGILTTLSHCIELVNQREETWRKRLEKEQERRKKIEDAYKLALSEKNHRSIVLGGPDYEEGPYSAINEDEFFDAVDAALDKNDKEEERFREKLKHQQTRTPIPSQSELVDRISPKHPLYSEVTSVIDEHVKYAQQGVEEGSWQLLCEEGEMKLYKREVEIDGIVMDPLKAVHTVRGITGHEMCHYFFDIAYRMDWDHTLETTRIVDKIADDTVVYHQVHKRVWPATARDSVFWSHIRCLHDSDGGGGGGEPSDSDVVLCDDDDERQNIWVVCNYSTTHARAPPTKCVRVKMNVALVCQTYVTPPRDGGDITRDNLTCKITYSATVNPGGWAPASVLRQVYKREYPKFLKRFSQYVRDMSENKPIRF